MNSLRIKRIINRMQNYLLQSLAVVLFVCGIYIVPVVTFGVTNLPSIMSFQGNLNNSSGTPLGSSSGTSYYFKFSIWDSATVGSGTRLWPSTTPGTTTLSVRSGVFSVNIGDTANSYPDALTYNFNSPTVVYLQTEVSSDNISSETISPRQQINQNPSSFGTSTPIGISVVSIAATTTNSVGLTIQGFLNQTANLFQVRSDSNTNLFSINNTGGLFASSTLQVTGATRLYSTLTGTSASFSDTTATSTFSGLVDISKNLVVGNFISASTFNATSTTATSTFNGGLSLGTLGITSTTASSTIAGGLVITGGGLKLSTVLNCNGNNTLDTDSSGNIVCGTDQGSQTPWTSNVDAGGYNLTNGGSFTFTNFSATSTTAFSSIASFLSIGTTTLTTQSALFTVSATSSLSNRSLVSIFAEPSLSGTTTAFTILSNGNVGIGSTTPGTPLGVNGAAVIAGALTVQSFTATSTTATSTLLGFADISNNLVVGGFSSASTFNATSTTASSTFAGLLSVGGNATFGGFVGASTFNATSTTATSSLQALSISNFSNSSMTAGSISFYGAGGFERQDNSNLFWNSSTQGLGISTTSSMARLTVSATSSLSNRSLFSVFAEPFLGATTTALTVSSNGNVGIGTTTPTSTLGVHGSGYFSSSLFVGGAITATSTLNVTELTTLGNASTTQIGSTGSAYFGTTEGRVGIGTISPLGRLHAVGVVGGAPESATGGTITYDGDYVTHTFTSSGTFTPTQALTLECLVVAGGGGGGDRNGAAYEAGAGGAGGLVYTISKSVTQQAYTVTVGAGGASGGSNGQNSVFGDITALGGGYGGTASNGGTGGSGGGGSHNTKLGGAKTQGDSGGATGFGNNGANGGNQIGGGGGGAGAAASGMSGGAGKYYTISGASVGYAGGGAAYSGGGASEGGGGISSPGTVNTGGGGGGGYAGSGGAGGSGIVIVRYLNPTAAIPSAIFGPGYVGIGTTTPQWLLTSFSATTSQLALSAGAGISQWAFRNAGGNLYFATTTIAGTATTSTSALTILGSSGNVGIGTTTPGTTLGVNGSAVIASILTASIFNATSTTATSSLQALSISNFSNTSMTAGSISFYGAGGYERQSNANLFYDSTNNRFGLSTTSPSFLLSVQGNGYIGSNLFVGGAITATSTLTVSGASTFASTLGVTGLTTLGYASTTQIGSTGSAYFATGGGNVGIGTTTPASTLSVQGNSYVSGTSFFGGAITATSTLTVSGASTFASTLGVTGLTTLGYASTTQIGSTGAAYFATGGGNVGIGTTTPASTLSVQGNSYVSGTSFFGGAITATSTLTVSGASTFASTLGVTGLTTLGYASTTQIGSTGSAYFATGGGNVGIGTTIPLARLHAVGVVGGSLNGATGGTITYDGDYVIHTFTTSGTFTPTQSLSVEYLVVAGGGGGSEGGGGAGGFRTATGFAVTAQGYTVTVGAGGAGVGNNGAGGTGSDSVFSTITSLGGGGGNSQNGGSGGGGGRNNATHGTGTSGQGNDGGNGAGDPYPSGGGGGASAVGVAGSGSVSGNGGAGSASSISGASITYSGGGGGGGYSVQGNNTAGTGGAGGGGAGTVSDANGTAGTANRGGGGGGTASDYGVSIGGAGGSGIVVVRYLSPATSLVLAAIFESGNVGIGTTSPYSMLSIAGQVVGQNFNATSTTATSTFSGLFDISKNLVVGGFSSASTFNATSTAATSTFAGLVDISRNVVIGGFVAASSFNATSTTATSSLQALSISNFSNTSMTAGSISFYGAGGYERQSNANLFYDSNNNRFGLSTTSPSFLLSVQGNGYIGSNLFVGGAITATSTLTVSGLTTLGYASTTQIGSTGAAYFATGGGNVGIGTTLPYHKLSVIGTTNAISSSTSAVTAIQYGTEDLLSLKTHLPGATTLAFKSSLNELSSVLVPKSSLEIRQKAGATWTAKTAWNGPSLGEVTSPAPAFADLDNDGDLDMMVENISTNVVLAYENTGTASSPVWTAKSSWNVGTVANANNIAFADLDNDGDYDVMIGFYGGASNGTSKAYENTGTVSNPVWAAKSTWDLSDIGSNASPAFADLDNDGDYDVLIGEGAGTSKGYENTGTANSPTWAAKTAWDVADIGDLAKPAFADLDNDGDYDLIIGESAGTSKGYENTGITSSPIWTANTAWNIADVGDNASPILVDFDNDGDYDVMVGELAGVSYAYENTGSTASSYFAKNGSFGIGTSSPYARFSLHAFANGAYNNNLFAIASSTSSATTTHFAIIASGNVGIGVSSPTQLLHVGGGGVAFMGITTGVGTAYLCTTLATGIISTSTAACNSSSLRFKDNVETFSSSRGLSEVMQLRPVSYVYKPGMLISGNQIGFIAEEVANVVPEIVAYDSGGLPSGIDYAKLTPVLAQAIQQIGYRYGISSSAPTTTPSIYIASNGTVAVGTTTPDTSYALYVQGDAAATSFVNISTRDAKKDIDYLNEEDKRSIGERIRNIKIAEYRYNGEKGNAPLRLGLIAEEAPQEILSANGKGVDVYKFSTFLLAGMQELDKRITNQELRIANLEQLMASVRTSSSNGVSVQGVLDYLTGLGVKISAGVAEFRNVIADKLTAKNVEVSEGVSIKDKTTGEYYCIIVDNGVMKNILGKCGSSIVTSESTESGASSSPQTSEPTNLQTDITPPVITLNGANPAEISKSSPYIDLGVTVNDNVDTNLGFHSTGEVDVNTLGTYTIYYTATDQAGNTATTTRAVNIYDPYQSEYPAVGSTTQMTSNEGNL